jgi:RHS repeat-associated protein
MARFQTARHRPQARETRVSGEPWATWPSARHEFGIERPRRRGGRGTTRPRRLSNERLGGGHQAHPPFVLRLHSLSCIVATRGAYLGTGSTASSSGTTSHPSARPLLELERRDYGYPQRDLHLGFRFLYVGQYDVQWDNGVGLGLSYVHARHYSPTVGRFLQADPARADRNPYLYAEDSPISKWDPDGRFACRVIAEVRILDPIGIVVNSLKLDLRWTSKTTCCVGMKIITSLSWVTTISWYRYAPFPSWYPDAGYSRVTTGGVGATFVGIRAYQSWGYLGQFSTICPLCSNKLWASIFARSGGAAGCSFDWDLRMNTFGILHADYKCQYAPYYSSGRGFRVW